MRKILALLSLCIVFMPMAAYAEKPSGDMFGGRNLDTIRPDPSLVIYGLPAPRSDVFQPPKTFTGYSKDMFKTRPLQVYGEGDMFGGRHNYRHEPDTSLFKGVPNQG